jgi:hypothetical protein
MVIPPHLLPAAGFGGVPPDDAVAAAVALHEVVLRQFGRVLHPVADPPVTFELELLLLGRVASQTLLREPDAPIGGIEA